jgi:CubicO group peptidase (beta-lactamase class C family)
VSAGYLKSREGISGAYSERIDSLFRQWDRDRSPGAVLSVSYRGEIVHQRGYGVANVEDDVPFTADTVLRLGSTSKHLCATCVLLLENEGKLTLDDDIRAYVPELPDYGDVITLRHLLTMTSGLWDGINILLFAGLDAESPLKHQQLFDLYCTQPQLMFKPGDDCTYSNTNYSLLSLIIERVSGMSLAEFMRTRVFKPLSMDRSRLTPFMDETIDNKARGYMPAADHGFRAGFMRIELDGNGGVDSTINDMLKWFANYRDDRHFGPDYRQRMEAPVCLNDGRLLEYRLGINVVDYRGMEVVRHAGGMPGYLCDFVFYPQADLGIVLFTNLMDPDMLQIPDQVADIVLEDQFEQPLESTFVDARLAEVAALKGVYVSSDETLVLELLEEEGKLVCYLLGAIEPLHECEGWLTSGKNLVALRVKNQATDDTSVLELRLGCQPCYSMVRVPDPRVEAVPPPPDFASFTGIYRNSGLQEEHEVSLLDGKLQIAIPGPLRKLVWGELSPVVGDLFVALVEGEPSCTNVTVKFLRDEKGWVEALSYSLSRCRDVVFEKVGKRGGKP